MCSRTFTALQVCDDQEDQMDPVSELLVTLSSTFLSTGSCHDG